MLTYQGPKQDVQCLAYVPGPDGWSVAAGYWDELHVWPLAGGAATVLDLAPAEELTGTSGLEELAVSPNGDWIIGRWYRGVRWWRRRRGRWVDVGQTFGGQLAAAARGPDLVLVSGNQDPDSQQWRYVLCRGWLVMTDRPEFRMKWSRATAPHPDGKVTAGAGLAVLSPDGSRLATAAREKAVQLWDARTGTYTGTIPQRGFVEALAWSPDGGTLAVNAGVTVRLYDAATLAERIAWKVKYSYSPHLAWSPDGRTLATTDSGTGVHLWDAATCGRRVTLRAGRERRGPVAFAPDGLTVAAGGAGGSVAVWDV